jgi:hypothetical protein
MREKKATITTDLHQKKTVLKRGTKGLELALAQGDANCIFPLFVDILVFVLVTGKIPSIFPGTLTFVHCI